MMKENIEIIRKPAEAYHQKEPICTTQENTFRDSQDVSVDPPKYTLYIV